MTLDIDDISQSSAMHRGREHRRKLTSAAGDINCFEGGTRFLLLGGKYEI